MILRTSSRLTQRGSINLIRRQLHNNIVIQNRLLKTTRYRFSDNNKDDKEDFDDKLKAAFIKIDQTFQNNKNLFILGGATVSLSILYYLFKDQFLSNIEYYDFEDNLKAGHIDSITIYHDNMLYESFSNVYVVVKKEGKKYKMDNVHIAQFKKSLKKISEQTGRHVEIKEVSKKEPKKVLEEIGKISFYLILFLKIKVALV